MILSWTLGGGLLVASIYISVMLYKNAALRSKYDRVCEEFRVCSQARTSLRKQVDLYRAGLKSEALETKALRKAIAEHAPSLATKLLRDILLSKPGVRKDEDGNGTD